MHAKQRTIWCCDHCGKTKMTRPAMAKHEAGCTANIGRRCGHCAAVDGLVEFHDLIVALGGGSDAEFDAMCAVADHCPACIQTAVRWWREMTNLSPSFDLIVDTPGFHTAKINDWSYRSAAADFWNEVNANRVG